MDAIGLLRHQARRLQQMSQLQTPSGAQLYEELGEIRGEILDAVAELAREQRSAGGQPSQAWGLKQAALGVNDPERLYYEQHVREGGIVLHLNEQPPSEIG